MADAHGYAGIGPYDRRVTHGFVPSATAALVDFGAYRMLYPDQPDLRLAAAPVQFDDELPEAGVVRE